MGADWMGEPEKADDNRNTGAKGVRGERRERCPTRGTLAGHCGGNSPISPVAVSEDCWLSRARPSRLSSAYAQPCVGGGVDVDGLKPTTASSGGDAPRRQHPARRGGDQQ